jgi:hypothetical protein
MVATLVGRAHRAWQQRRVQRNWWQRWRREWGHEATTQEAARPGKDDPQEILHGCSETQMQKKAAKPCNMQHDDDYMRGVANSHYVRCTGKPKGKVAHPKMQCCQDSDTPGGEPSCKDIRTKKK